MGSVRSLACSAEAPRFLVTLAVHVTLKFILKYSFALASFLKLSLSWLLTLFLEAGKEFPSPYILLYFSHGILEIPRAFPGFLSFFSFPGVFLLRYSVFLVRSVFLRLS